MKQANKVEIQDGFSFLNKETYNKLPLTRWLDKWLDKQANKVEIKDGFSFLKKETYNKLPLTRWLDKSGHPIPGNPELPVKTVAEIKLFEKGDPVPLDLLAR